MNQKNFQSHFGYLSHRSISSKVSHNNISPTAGNNIQTSFEKQEKDGSKLKRGDTDQLSSIHKQNSILKQENRVLKRQLNYYRAENLLQASSKDGKNQMNDLRETIKKQAGQIKDLKTRLQMLSKQCKMYEDIIEKMEMKINKLTDHNNKLQDQLKSKGQKFQLSSNVQKIDNQYEKYSLELLHQKVNQIVSQFHDLEMKFANENNEWERWKQHWNRQKAYYLHRIQDLQSMMGISNEYSDFSKNKRF